MSILVFKKNATIDDCSSPTLKISPSRGNKVYTSHKAIYQDLSVLSFLSKDKFPVHLVRSNVTKRTYAMKVFTYENGQPHMHYINESRFASLQHPNVVKSLFFEGHKQAEFDNIPTQISYMIKEHATQGDLLTFLRNNHAQFDETLTRTFFRHLIQGLEYLHNNEIAHLDIKLANLVLGSDFTLKIGDFDQAHFSEDAIIISSGTKMFRAPEIQQGNCTNPKAADIYSAGTILFILKTQGAFPHLEDDIDEGVDFAYLRRSNLPEFWEAHCKVQNKSRKFFDKDFCDLFVGMTKDDPKRRMSLEQIKQSNWYNGPVYDSEELVKKFGRSF